MTTNFSQRQQELLAEIAEAEKRLSELLAERSAIQEQHSSLDGERQQYQLLEEICSSLDKLAEIGGAALFWGESPDMPAVEEKLQRSRASVADFRAKTSAADEAILAVQKSIDRQGYLIDNLQDGILELQEQEERAKYDFSITREERELPYRRMIMPWTKQGEDEWRFRKTLLLVLLFTLTFGLSIPFWELPKPDKNEPVEIPEHLVKLVKKEKPKPKPPEKKPEEKPKEKAEEKKPEDKPKPTPAETQQARKKAESSGVLAFKDAFSDLLQDDVNAKLGSSAKLSNKGAKASGDASRNLVMSQAQDTSGGINTASLSRGVGGGAGKQIGSGVSFSRVESGIGTDFAADDRPLSDGPGPSRTDEEIQIVFDRYKAALYRIYNKELRKNPTLRGKMVLRITIEPDGSVSVAKVESTDMNSPELSAAIVERVQKFNFGPKDGVPKTTILYPIDFLPAT